jgi:hypothetical protein
MGVYTRGQLAAMCFAFGTLFGVVAGSAISCEDHGRHRVTEVPR